MSAPASVPVDVVREYLDARACYEAATRPPNSHAPAPALKHGDPTILRLREARKALEDAIAIALADHQRPKCGRKGCDNGWVWVDGDEVPCEVCSCYVKPNEGASND